MYLLLQSKCYKIAQNSITYNIWDNHVTIKNGCHVNRFSISFFMYILLYQVMDIID